MSPTAPAPFVSMDDPGMAEVSPDAAVVNEDVVVPDKSEDVDEAPAPADAAPAPSPGSPEGIFGMLMEGDMEAPAAPTLLSILPMEMLMDPLAMLTGRPEAESTWGGSSHGIICVYLEISYTRKLRSLHNQN